MHEVGNIISGLLRTCIALLLRVQASDRHPHGTGSRERRTQGRRQERVKERLVGSKLSLEASKRAIISSSPSSHPIDLLLLPSIFASVDTLTFASLPLPDRRPAPSSHTRRGRDERRASSIRTPAVRKGWACKANIALVKYQSQPAGTRFRRLIN